MVVIMKENYTLKEIEEGEIKDVIKFHNKYFMDNRSTAIWKHEYQSYMPEKYVFCIAKKDNEIIGTNGMLPIQLKIQKKSVLTSKGESSLIALNYRGSPIFRNLYQFVIDKLEKRDVKIIWGITNFGLVWKRILHFNVFDKIFKNSIIFINFKNSFIFIKNRLINENQKKGLKYPIIIFVTLCLLFYKLYFFFFAIKRFFLRLISQNEYFSVEKVNNTSDIENLLESVNNEFNLIQIEQQKEYLNWRIYDNPILDYKTIYIYKKGNKKRLLGYAYFSINKSKNTGGITEFVSINKSVSEILINRGFSFFKENKVGFCRYFGNSKNTIVNHTLKYLRKNGFLNIKENSSFIFKSLTKYEIDEKYENNPKNWYITGLWTEGFRI